MTPEQGDRIIALLEEVAKALNGRCHACDGTGRVSRAETKVCPCCHGSGLHTEPHPH